MTTIFVLDRSTYGIPTSECAATLRERLPDATVRHPEITVEMLNAVTGAAVTTSTSFSDEVLDATDELQLFVGAAVGYDHLPLETLRGRGVRVTNAPGIHDPNITERVTGWLLMTTRRLDEGLRHQRRREWRRFQSYGELQGSTVTVVGPGAIGQTAVKRLDMFDVKTVGVRYMSGKGGPTDEILGFDDLESALVHTDFLVIACPLTDKTRDLIDRRALSALPEHAILVNVARGGVVDINALVSHLRSNRLRATVLDVTDPEPLPEDHPLWGFENVYITPHASDRTPHYWARVVDILTENVGQLASAPDGKAPTLRNQVVPSPNP